MKRIIRWFIVLALIGTIGFTGARTHAQTLTALYQGLNDPNGGLVMDAQGNLYGTTIYGGDPSTNGGNGYGEVFKLDPLGNETVLYAFTGGADGCEPIAGLIIDAQGNLYGTTEYGGDLSINNGQDYPPPGAGVVFMVDPSGNETVLHTFNGTSDGAYPQASLFQDPQGNLYGTAQQGGAFGEGTDSGGVNFILMPPTGGLETWTYSVEFPWEGFPQLNSSLIEEATTVYGYDTVFGTSVQGGYYGRGQVYAVGLVGLGVGTVATEISLYSFSGGTDGWNPFYGVIMDAQGNLYGTTPYGGDKSTYFGGYGVVFKLNPITGTYTVLHTFTDSADGGEPLCNLIQDSQGNLYGTTFEGGVNAKNNFGGYGYGVLFKVDPSGNYSILYAFTGGNDGAYPYGGLVQDSQGNLYGTTYFGGVFRFGFGLTVLPAIVTGGSSSTGTVYLPTPAPTGGAVVSLRSSNTAAVQVPATVTVPSGQTSATFSAMTSPVQNDTAVTISDTFDGSSGSAVLTVEAPGMGGLSLDPTIVTGGNPSTGTVYLSSSAPAGGAVVSLVSSNTAAVQVPATVTVPSGQTSATFSAMTSPVQNDTAVTISGIFHSSASNILTVDVPIVTALTLAPTTVTGGNSSIGTVTISSPAPSGGYAIGLSSANTSVVQVPATVTIPAGQTTATFTATTTPIQNNTTVIITATANGTNANAVLTVDGPIVTALTLAPTTVTGGNSSIGTVTISSPAPSGGDIVGLSSANTSVVQVPATVTIPAGQTTATFTATTTMVTVITPVVISSGANRSSQTATLTVTNVALKSVSVKPKSVKSGSSATGTVTLTKVAPTGGAIVTLSSSDAAVASVPTSVTVLSGQMTATFPVTTTSVSSTTEVTISVSYGGTTKTTKLKVKK